MTCPRISRRTLVTSAPSAALLAFLGTADRGRKDPAARLAGILVHRKSAMALGAAYLARRPEEHDVAALMAQLSKDLDLESWQRNGRDMARLGDAIRQRARMDYRDDNCIMIAGCYLPVTELRLCALATLAG